MLDGHGGNIYEAAKKLDCDPVDIVDMSSNVNPIGSLPNLINFLKENMFVVMALPEVNSKTAAAGFAERFGIESKLVLVGNGTTQFIYSLPQALGVKNVAILGPTYADYADACSTHKINYTYLTAKESHSFQHDMDYIQRGIQDFDMVFVCNPNNPTGMLISASNLESLCSSYPNTYFVIDESYMSFVNNGEQESLIKSKLPNVIVLDSMSKIFKIPGLRIGFLRSSEKIIEKLTRYALPWSVNSLAQLSTNYITNHKSETDAFIKNTQQFIEAEKQLFAQKLKNAPNIKMLPSKTSFFLIKLSGKLTADNVCAYFLRHKILIRNCANFTSLSNRFIRISLKTKKNNSAVAKMLLELT